MMGRIDAPLDAFHRVRCEKCGKAPVLAQHSKKRLICKSCQHVTTDKAWVYLSRLIYCSVCMAFAVRWGTEEPRCCMCQCKWENAGKPYQTLRVYRGMDFALDWRTVPHFDVDSYLETAIAIRKNEEKPGETANDQTE